MSSTAARDDPRLTESQLAADILAVAASRSLRDLEETCHRAMQRLIGSTSMGLYTLIDGLPRLVTSRDISSDFLDDYARQSRAGDILVERMCERRCAVDGATELEGAWLDSGNQRLLQRWGYAHCMGGPLLVNERVVGVLYTARGGSALFTPGLRYRMDMLCQAGSIAVATMLDLASLTDAPGEWANLAVHPRVIGPVSPHLRLAGRSREVAELLSQGCTNKEIARALGLSAYTIKDYVGALCRRFDVHNRTQLAHWLATSHRARGDREAEAHPSV